MPIKRQLNPPKWMLGGATTPPSSATALNDYTVPSLPCLGKNLVYGILKHDKI